MSNIKLQGDVSGTGSLTIAAPNTDVDRVLTLPDETGTLLTSGNALMSDISDYESGTFSTSLDSISATTNTVTGTYVKIGDVVHIQGEIYIDGFSAQTGNPSFLCPFVPSSTETRKHALQVHYSSTTNKVGWLGIYNGGVATYPYYANTQSVVTLGNGRIAFNGTYTTA